MLVIMAMVAMLVIMAMVAMLVLMAMVAMLVIMAIQAHMVITEPMLVRCKVTAISEVMAYLIPLCSLFFAVAFIC